MFMDLYLRVIDEENRLLPIRLLKVRTKCDATIRESIQNFLCGDSDDSEYELVDTPLLSKAKQFKVNNFFYENIFTFLNEIFLYLLISIAPGMFRHYDPVVRQMYM